MRLVNMFALSAASLLVFNVYAKNNELPNNLETVDDAVIAKQRANLSQNTKGKGFGPQSPRDIDQKQGNNKRIFSHAPAAKYMNLCNIHFHKFAEHKGGEFTKFAGNGNGKGYLTGFVYSGELTQKELKPFEQAVCADKFGGLQSGDTIELHYVHTTAKIDPGPSLGACLNESTGNPQLRVEAQVFVLVNDENADDFEEYVEHGYKDGLHQALNIPQDTGRPIVYAGSTTGPAYNENGSPLKVTWSVRPQVKKVDIDSVGDWCENNDFNESKAHGVRNLVINPDLLSEIE